MDEPADPGLVTPTAPLPAIVETTEAPRPRRPLLPAAVTAGLAWVGSGVGVLLLVLVVQLLLGLTVVLPFHARMSERLDLHAHVPALAGRPDAFDREQAVPAGLDGGVWADTVRLEAPMLESLPLVLFVVLTVAWLFGAVVAGGVLGTAVDGRGRPTTSRFLSEGGRWFFRMARVGIVFALAYLTVGRLVFEAWGGTRASTEAAADSELSVLGIVRVREAVFLLLFLWMRAAADLARADLVVFGRRSAFLAFFRALGRTLRHPVRTLLPALLLGLPVLALLWVLGLATDALETGGPWTVVATFLVLQLAVLLRWASRAAVLAADAHVVRSLTRPA